MCKVRPQYAKALGQRTAVPPLHAVICSLVRWKGLLGGDFPS